MSLLPDWAPNIHPLIVHFPIALLFAAALIDTIGLFLKEKDFWRKAAMGLYALGALGAVAAFFSGRQAADSVFLPTDANALLTEHADLGQWVFYLFAAYSIIRVILFVLNTDKKTSIRATVWLIGLVGCGMVWVTAEKGAELVFKHGAGVQAAAQETTVVAVPDSSGEAGPVMNDEGGWSFRATRAGAWMESMTVYGDVDGLTPSLQDGGDRGDVLALTASGDPVMLVFDHEMFTVQMDGGMNLDRFDGTVMWVSHVADEANYQFTSFTRDGQVRQGASENGDLIIMDNQQYDAAGWHAYRTVADQTHFRAYSDQAMIAHGHGADPGSGHVGIRLNGSGTVLIDFLKTASLRGEGR